MPSFSVTRWAIRNHRSTKAVFRRWSAVASAALLSTLSPAPADADSWTNHWIRCRGEDPIRQIRACSALIGSRRETQANLARAHFNRGHAFTENGEFDRAIQDFGRALMLDPDYPDAFNSRGLAYVARGEAEKAIQDFDRAIALDPNYAIAIYNRALAVQSLGRAAEAAQGFENAKQAGPRLKEPKE